MIPLKIFQTWHSEVIPYEMSRVILKVKEINPEFEYFLFDINKSRQFIESNFDSEILQAYDTLIPFAYKADLWKLCVLYKEGGIYLDTKFEPINDFKFINLTEKNHFALDTPSNNGISVGLMVVKPNQSELLVAINQIVNNVKNQFYGNNSLEITGPLLLKSIIKDDIDLKHILDNSKNIRGYTKNDILILNEYQNYRKELTMYGDSYYNQWINRKIYKTLIPKNIYYTFKNNNFPENIVKIIENNKKLCPDYSFNFYDDHMCENFIKQNFDDNVYRAYMKINPKLGAMKSDFWRYCILYELGGIYLDIKIKLLKNLNEIIKPLDRCIFMPPNLWGPNRKRNNIPVYEQWILLFYPKHHYLKKMIEVMTMNILNEYEPPCDILNYPECSLTKHKILHTTGPDALAKVIHSCEKDHTICDINFAEYNDYDKKKLYADSNTQHYSEIKESLYIKYDNE